MSSTPPTHSIVGNRIFEGCTFKTPSLGNGVFYHNNVVSHYNTKDLYHNSLVHELIGSLDQYLVKQCQVYKDRFETEPSKALLRLFVERFLDEQYPIEELGD